MNWKNVFLGLIQFLLVVIPWELGTHFEIDLLKYIAMVFLSIIIIRGFE